MTKSQENMKGRVRLVRTAIWQQFELEINSDLIDKCP